MHVPGYIRKVGLSYTNPEKWGQSYTFCWKKGPIIYLAVLKKGGIRHAHPYYAIYRKLHRRPRPPRSPETQPWAHRVCVGFTNGLKIFLDLIGIRACKSLDHPAHIVISWLSLVLHSTCNECHMSYIFKYIENFTNTNWKFSDKNSNIFHISAQNIDCGYSLEPPRRGGSNEYTQSIFLSRNKKNNVYTCKPQFYYIKMGLKVVKII